MVNEDKYFSNKNSSPMENFKVEVTNPMLYDRLHTLSIEYSVSIELLVNVAVKRLVDDIDFIRELRSGKIDLR